MSSLRGQMYISTNFVGNDIGVCMFRGGQAALVVEILQGQGFLAHTDRCTHSSCAALAPKGARLISGAPWDITLHAIEAVSALAELREEVVA